jgi:hypothetical protein
MYTLYGLFILMLIGAFCLLFLPVRVSSPFNYQNSLVFFAMTIFSFSIYLFFTHTIALTEWINHGQQHYELLVEYNQLGGIDGMIAKIKQKLSQNPGDEQGQIILKKLYHIKHEQTQSSQK